MAADKRSVHTDALETLGTIIDSTQNRDAIHLGVEPIVAGEKLKPGMHVAILEGEAFQYAKNRVGMKAVGIVDPFLAEPVKQGERFWLVVYPRQITSLRHVWEHPDFPASVDVPSSEKSTDKTASEEWLIAFCEEKGPGYFAVMQRIEEFCNGDTGWSDEYLHFNDMDAHGEIPDEFWDHYEVVAGVRPKRPPTFFSCSC